MVVPNPMVKGGIAAVVNGYRGSQLEDDYEITYVESYRDGSKIAKLWKAICSYFHFASVLIFHRPDIVHIHSSFGPSFYRKIPFIYMASWAKIPVINHIHGSEFSRFYLDAGEKKQDIVRNVWKKCTRFIVLSDEWEKTFSVVIPQRKMTTIENYCSIVPRITRENNHIVLFMGLINRMKGCYDIVDVISEVRKKISDIKMVMCGEGEIEQIEDRAREQKVLDCFVFPGWVKNQEKEKVLRQANVFFLPSYSEGMPMAILDAMGYGLPIVATNVGGIPRIVHDGENGYCCEPGDIQGMAATLVEMLSDCQKLEQYGRQSVNIAKNRYSLEQHLHQIEELYEEVLSED